MTTLVYGICLSPEEAAQLAVVLRPFSPVYSLLTSLSPPPAGAAGRYLSKSNWARIQSASDFLAPLVRSTANLWPRGKANAEIIMEEPPANFQAWVCRNLLWQFCTQSFIYLVHEETLRQQDLTVHLTVAKMFGHMTIGILPSASRVMLESTQMTLTDAIVGEAEPRCLSALLGSLEEAPEDETDE